MRPCEEVLGDEHDEHPSGVERETLAREVQQAGGFGIFDAVLGVGVAMVAGFKVDDVLIPRAGYEDLVVLALGVEELELGADVGLLSPAALLAPAEPGRSLPAKASWVWSQ